MNILHGGSVSAAVVLPANNLTTTSGSIPVYSGLKIDADGNLYERTPNGGWSQFAVWLLAGTASTYYVSRTILTGTLTTDAGAGPLQLNADREYDVQTSKGTKDASVQFDIASDVSGTPIVASRTYTFLASTLD
jgi:hypothetical protein